MTLPALFIYAGTTFITTLVIFAWIGKYFKGIYGCLYRSLSDQPEILHSKNREDVGRSLRKRSIMRGRFVDIVTNIFPVKIFARRAHEDAYFRRQPARQCRRCRETGNHHYPHVPDATYPELLDHALPDLRLRACMAYR